jgi:hypothetical protein
MTASISQAAECTHADSEAASESFITNEIAREMQVGLGSIVEQKNSQASVHHGQLFYDVV